MHPWFVEVLRFVPSATKVFLSSVKKAPTKACFKQLTPLIAPLLLFMFSFLHGSIAISGCWARFAMKFSFKT
jgi:hypothetical protein